MVAVKVMLCVTMRILAGVCYLALTWPYGIGVPTVYTVFDEVLVALGERLKFIVFPTTEKQCRDASKIFTEKQQLPISGIIAALDGWAVTIEKPKIKDTKIPRKYRNRKGFFAIVVHVAVVADYKFVFVAATLY